VTAVLQLLHFKFNRHRSFKIQRKCQKKKDKIVAHQHFFCLIICFYYNNEILIRAKRKLCTD
jgi:hypothetical protein